MRPWSGNRPLSSRSSSGSPCLRLSADHCRASHSSVAFSAHPSDKLSCTNRARKGYPEPPRRTQTRTRKPLGLRHRVHSSRRSKSPWRTASMRQRSAPQAKEDVKQDEPAVKNATKKETEIADKPPSHSKPATAARDGSIRDGCRIGARPPRTIPRFCPWPAGFPSVLLDLLFECIYVRVSSTPTSRPHGRPVPVAPEQRVRPVDHAVRSPERQAS